MSAAADGEPPQEQQAPSLLQQGANLVAAGASGAYNAAASTYAALPAVLPSTRAAQAEEAQAQEEEEDNAQPEQPAQAADEQEAPAGETQDGAEALSPKERRRLETEQSGPSDPARLNKSQQELGTEYDVPTSAGLGTTLSADARALDAARAAKSDGAAAHVPQDYMAEPTPGDEDHACDMMAGDKASRSGASGSGTGTSASAASGETAPTSTEEQVSGGGGGATKHKVGLGAKLKGAGLVAAGKLTRNEAKVQHGKAVKHGEE